MRKVGGRSRGWWVGVGVKATGNCLERMRIGPGSKCKAAHCRSDCFSALLIANSHGRLAHAHLRNRIFPTEKAPTTTQASSEIKLQTVRKS